MTETTEAAGKAPRVSATITETIEMHRLLVANMAPIPGSPDMWKFAEGWSDERVAREASKGRLHSGHAQTVRAEYGMKLKPSWTKSPKRGDEALIEQHNAMCRYLATRLGDMAVLAFVVETE